MKTSIVTTTINPPIFLREYSRNFKEFNVALEDLTFIVVGDNKTPKNFGSKEIESFVEYWTPKEQDKWLKHNFQRQFKKIKKLLIPEDDMRRRNFGYLRAVELQSDIVITIDDDNLPLKEKSWLADHLVGLDYAQEGIYSKNRIVNPCTSLNLNHDDIYSRGYPLSHYFSYDEFIDTISIPPVLNMGLWEGKPDVDSFTNLLYPDLISKGLHDEYGFSLAENNYFPVDTQNTSFKNCLNIFHNLYMSPALFHRFDDIWMGLFAQKLMHKMGHTASYGHPIVNHKRNSHNYGQDFKTEFMGIILNSKMWKVVMEMNIESKNYRDGFLEIAEHIPTMFNENKTIHRFFERMKESMVLWVELIETL